LSEAGGLKTKAEPQRRKGRKGNYAFSMGGTDGERTMMEMLNRYKHFSIKSVTSQKVRANFPVSSYRVLQIQGGGRAGVLPVLQAPDR